MNDLKLSNALPAQAYAKPRPAPAAEEKPATSAVKAPTVKEELQKAAQPAETLKAEPNAKELKRLTEEVQRHFGGANSQLEFSVDEETGQSIVKVLDRQTKEVIRQIPSEEMLQIAEGLDRYKEGLLVNSQA